MRDVVAENKAYEARKALEGKIDLAVPSVSEKARRYDAIAAYYDLYSDAAWLDTVIEEGKELLK